ncbi:MAG: TlpA disulfide reductase family protein [Pseudohongiellaceae bacterium]
MKRTFLTWLAGISLLLPVSSALAVEEGEQAPDFTLPSIHSDGEAITLSKFRGKVVYVDFWASWCAPCLRSLPLYNELYSRYQEAGLEIIAVNIDNPIEDGQDFLIDTPLDFRIPSDIEGETPELYRVIGMPTSYLVDAEGTVRMVHVGFRDGDVEKIEAEIRDLLGI